MEALVGWIAVALFVALILISHLRDEAKRERRRADEIEKYGKEQKRRAGDPFD